MFGDSPYPVQRVGQRVFTKVGKDLVVDLKGGEVCRVEDCLFGECFDGGRGVALGVDEFVVEDLHARVVGWEEGDLVGDGLGVGEGGDVAAYAREAELDVPAARTAELGF